MNKITIDRTSNINEEMELHEKERYDTDKSFYIISDNKLLKDYDHPFRSFADLIYFVNNMVQDEQINDEELEEVTVDVWGNDDSQPTEIIKQYTEGTIPLFLKFI